MDKDQILLRIPSPTHDCLIVPSPGLLEGHLEKLLPFLGHNPLALITDEQTAYLYSEPLLQAFSKKNIPSHLFSFPIGEKHKCRSTLSALQDELLDEGLGKNCTIVAIGGGVVTDIAGLLAATHCRGVPLILIPSTLLAMVDAAIGGKNGVNTHLGKNMVGTFYLPKAVMIDNGALTTLPPDQMRAGIAEMIKHAVIASKELFIHLEIYSLSYATKKIPPPLPLILDNVRIKSHIVEQDPQDYGMRRLLNLGHTVAHALEAVSCYKISHGDAVLAGTAIECTCSYLQNLLPQSSWQRITSLLLKLFPSHLATFIPHDPDILWQTMTLDKKSLNSAPHITFIEDIAKPAPSHGLWCQPLPYDLFKSSLQWFHDILIQSLTHPLHE